jgi:hypothetical protein
MIKTLEMFELDIQGDDIGKLVIVMGCDCGLSTAM